MDGLDGLYLLPEPLQAPLPAHLWLGEGCGGRPGMLHLPRHPLMDLLVRISMSLRSRFRRHSLRYCSLGLGCDDSRATLPCTWATAEV